MDHDVGFGAYKVKITGDSLNALEFPSANKTVRPDVDVRLSRACWSEALTARWDSHTS